MSAETAAYAALTGSPGMTAAADRVYPDFVPTGKEQPSIAITRTETEYLNTIHDGVPVAKLVSLEVWCMATSRVEAESLGDAALAVLGAAGFTSSGRRPEVVPETEIFAAVLEMQYWET